jgi:hypothetical protein
LLEREGALKVLAAVQAAAEDEMAFEQRAAVAENLEDFVLCHRTDYSGRFRCDKLLLIGGGWEFAGKPLTGNFRPRLPAQ